MELAVPLISRFGLLALQLSYIAVPGVALLFFFRFRSEHRVDAFLSAFGLGLAYSGLGVCLLLLFNLYTLATAVLLLILPAAYLLYLTSRPTVRLTNGFCLPAGSRSFVSGIAARIRSTGRNVSSTHLGRSLSTADWCAFANAIGFLLLIFSGSSLRVRAAASVLLILPPAYLLFLFRASCRERTSTSVTPTPRSTEKKNLDAKPVKPTPTLDTAVRGLSPADWCAISFASLFILFALIDSLTSPIGAPAGWDQYITWDKWAADWARRRNLYGYIMGGYPQLQPMFCSVLYKLTNTSQAQLPAAVFSLHAIHPVIASVMLVATVRFCMLLSIPCWPVLLIAFGQSAVRDAVTNGSADLLLTTLLVLAVVLTIAWLRSAWTTRLGFVPVLAPVLFAAACTKTTGLFGIAFVLAVLWAGRRTDKVPVPSRLLLVTVIISLLLCVPFHGSQLAQAGTPGDQLSPYEVSFPIHSAVTGLEHAAAAHHPNQGAARWVSTSLLRIFNGYEISSELAVFMCLLFGASIIASCFVPYCRPLLMVAGAYLAMWIRWASYDLRNVLPIVPIFAVCLCAGGLALYRLFVRQRALKVLVHAALALFVACTAAGWGKALAASAGLVTKPANIMQRLAVIAGGPDAAIPFFYPADAPPFQLLNRSAIERNARHVVAVGRMYRWFHNGCYPTSYWSHYVPNPGDVYVGLMHMQPPDPSAYTLLMQSPPHKVWVNQSKGMVLPREQIRLGGPHPPILRGTEGQVMDIEYTGTSSMVFYNLQDRTLPPGASLVWRVVAQATTADPDIVPGFMVYNRKIIDTDRTSVATDTSRINQGIITYSGVLTLLERPSPITEVDGVLVGAFASRAGTKLRLREFRISLYR